MREKAAAEISAAALFLSHIHSSPKHCSLFSVLRKTTIKAEFHMRSSAFFFATKIIWRKVIIG